MTPADLYESTHFVLDPARHIESTREPNPSADPLCVPKRAVRYIAQLRDPEALVSGPSLGVARQLGLVAHASGWSVSAAGPSR